MTKTFEIQNKEYFKFKKLLQASPEDRELALEGLKNVEISLIRRILLGKSLNRHERYSYIEQNEDLDKYMIPWNLLFKELKKLKPNDHEKDLINEEFSKEFIPLIKDHHEFVKDIKFELAW